MKMMTLAISTTLIIGVSFGTSIESALAIRRPILGWKWFSVTNSDEPNITFELLQKDSNGNIIPGIGKNGEFIFEGAIKNFDYSDESSLSEIQDIKKQCFSADFAQLCPDGQFSVKFGVGDLRAKLNGDSIVYTAFSNRVDVQFGDPRAIPDLTPSLAPFDVFTFSLDIKNLNLSEVEKKQFVASLPSLIERLDTLSKDESNSPLPVIEIKAPFKFDNGVGDSNSEENGITPISDSEKVPEPNTAASLLALATLATGLLQKRRLT
jgi:hypothetical protein